MSFGGNPQLEKALRQYDWLNSGSLPETGWLGRPSQQKCQKEIDAITDAARHLPQAMIRPIEEAHRDTHGNRYWTLIGPPTSAL